MSTLFPNLGVLGNMYGNWRWISDETAIFYGVYGGSHIIGIVHPAAGSVTPVDIHTDSYFFPLPSPDGKRLLALLNHSETKTDQISSSYYTFTLIDLQTDRLLGDIAKSKRYFTKNGDRGQICRSWWQGNDSIGYIKRDEIYTTDATKEHRLAKTVEQRCSISVPFK